ncbi:MAG: VRR-NUC domain-containing protein [Halobacteria archaeon]|nr:VRR-NUC domain-containing protein [Halobacteria archaeon]
MPYFTTVRNSVCEGCGETFETGISTDLFSDNRDLLSSERNALEYCFQCYLERVDTIYYALLVSLTVPDEYIVIGAENADHAERVSEELSASPLGPWIEDYTYHRLEEAYSTDTPTDYSDRGTLTPYYTRELARGIGSESWNIYSGVRLDDDDRMSAMDWWTHVREETRGDIRSELLDYVVGSDEYQEVEVREDIDEVFEEVLPVLSGYGLTSGLRSQVWDHIRENDPYLLSDRSRMAMKNQKKGRRFERFFRDLCRENNLECYRDTRYILRSRYPEEYAKLLDEFGRGFNGLPDFFVDANANQSTLERWTGGSRVGWKPDGEAFVEVKYGTSDLSPEQRRVVSHLSEAGFDVYVLRGTPDEHSFERY